MLAAASCSGGICDAHLVVALIVVAGWFVAFVWALVYVVRKRLPGTPLRRLVQAMEGILLLQIVIGAVVFFTGHRPDTVLHYGYGGLFPLIVIGLDHMFGMEMKEEADRWKVTMVAAFLVFGLTLRATMTGLGLP